MCLKNIPLWKKQTAEYDIDYIEHYKGDNPNVVGVETISTLMINIQPLANLYG